MPGGFLGVDVFFVISGYLITSILLREMTEGRFSLARFYERRARRILPALLVVVLACLPFAWVLMTPDQLAAFGLSLAALTVFATNFLFWRESGYFSPDADQIALLHTWSLAVEEQFYLLFPLIILGFWRWRRHWIPVVLTLFCILGLVAAEMWARSTPDAAFYLLHARAWELVAGAAAAAWTHRGASWLSAPERVAHGLAALGAVGIVASLALMSPQAAVPGVAALGVVGGTALLLLFARPGGSVHWLLSWSPLVGIGLISYSAYLWHQPVFAFTRLALFEPPSPGLMAVATALTFLLAWATWRWVEQPFRDPMTMSLRRGAERLGAGAGAVLISGGLLFVGGGFADLRYAPGRAAAFASVQHSPMRDACHDQPDLALAPEQACRYLINAPPTWAVYGDSHGVEIAYALAERLKRRGESLVHLTASSCPPAIGFPSTMEGCETWNEQSLRWLEQAERIRAVMLVWRHNGYLFGENADFYPELPNETHRLGGEGSLEEKRDAYWRGVAQIAARLQAAGKRVVLAAPTPEIGRGVGEWLKRGELEQGRLATIDRDYYEARSRFVRDRMGGLGVDIMDVAQHLCDGERCYGVLDGQALYFDHNHLSVLGARRVVADLPLD